MTRVSNFRDAIRHTKDGEPIICIRCGSCDLEPPAKPTLEREQDGSVTCSCCGANFTLEHREVWSPAYRASQKHDPDDDDGAA